jgi:hypothetical protein
MSRLHNDTDPFEYDNAAVKQFPKKGEGLFAKQRINASDLVRLYTGKIV